MRYLQHCEWAANVYKPWYGDKVCDTWFAGIETEKWAPSSSPKNTDILIYNKIRWNKEKYQEELVQPIKEILRNRGLSYKEIVYGFYKEEDYHSLLKECKSMIFLCEHESQGFACCEAMSMNIPVLAWDQGYCLDPNRFKWGEPKIPASSVPFFSEKCGERFSDINDFSHSLPGFWQKVSEGFYEPRTYILDNLTLEKSAERMLDIVRTSLQNN